MPHLELQFPTLCCSFLSHVDILGSCVTSLQGRLVSCLNVVYLSLAGLSFAVDMRILFLLVELTAVPGTIVILNV